MEKRASHINRLFYETISQIIANGELDVYIDITKVKVVPDFSSVVIYWEASGTEEDADTEKILEKKTGYLRSLMMKSNILGRIPPVTFVKDRTYSSMQEIERLLRIAELPPPEENSGDSAKSGGIVEMSSKSGDSIKTSTMSGDSVEMSAKSVDSVKTTAGLLHTDESEYICNGKGGEKENVDIKIHTGYSEVLADKINLRQDLYGVKHDTLMQKIRSMKTSSRHRLQQPVDLATLKSSVSFTDNFQKFDKAMSKKTRAETLKKYSEFFHKQKHKGRHREDMADLMSVSEIDVDEDYEYENEAEYEFDSGIEEYYSDDKDRTENVIEQTDDSENNAVKPS